MTKTFEKQTGMRSDKNDSLTRHGDNKVSLFKDLIFERLYKYRRDYLFYKNRVLKFHFLEVKLR